MILHFLIILYFLDFASSQNRNTAIISFEGEILARGLSRPSGAGGCRDSSVFPIEGPSDHWYSPGCIWAPPNNRSLKRVTTATIEQCIHECSISWSCTHFYWRPTSQLCHLQTGYGTYGYGVYGKQEIAVTDYPYIMEYPHNNIFCGVNTPERKNRIKCTNSFLSLLEAIYNRQVFGGLAY